MSKTLIALATYNEIENIPSLAERILEIVPDADLLIIDDSSPDGTGEWALQKAEEEPRLQVLSRVGKLGLGTAVLAAFDAAISGDYDYLVNLDADFSHPPEKIPELIASVDSGKSDVAIGSRYIRGGKIVGWPLRRRLMSRGVNAYVRLLLGLKTHDNSGAFRCYRVSLLKELDPHSVISRGYSFFEEILFRLQGLGARFEEIPITFTDRVRGVTKVNTKEVLAAMGLLFKIALFRR